MEQYYALVEEYRNEYNDLYFTKVLCMSLSRDDLKAKMKNNFSKSCKDAKEMLGTEDFEIYESEFSCSIELAFRSETFSCTYNIQGIKEFVGIEKFLCEDEKNTNGLWDKAAEVAKQIAYSKNVEGPIYPEEWGQEIIYKALKEVCHYGKY